MTAPDKRLSAAERMRAIVPVYSDHTERVLVEAVAACEAHARAAVEAEREKVRGGLEMGREVRSGVRASILEMLEDSERDRENLTRELAEARAEIAALRCLGGVPADGSPAIVMARVAFDARPSALDSGVPIHLTARGHARLTAPAEGAETGDAGG